MKDEDKIQGLVGRHVVWADFDGSYVHLETEDGLMFHIRIDADDEYEAVEVHGDLPN